jgi:hypothetical protein
MITGKFEMGKLKEYCKVMEEAKVFSLRQKKFRIRCPLHQLEKKNFFFCQQIKQDTLFV